MLRKEDRHYMQLALLVAQASKCVRAQYGSVLVTARGTVASTGRNGKPAGSCNDTVCYREGLPANAPKDNCCLHSEANCFLFSKPEDRVGGTLYVSGIPCHDCALLIMQSGVTRLVYFTERQAHGHVGSSDDPFWEKYGARLERVPFTFAAHEAAYGAVPTVRAGG